MNYIPMDNFVQITDIETSVYNEEAVPASIDFHRFVPLKRCRGIFFLNCDHCSQFEFFEKNTNRVMNLGDFF
jgi:hypothetical protein